MIDPDMSMNSNQVQMKLTSNIVNIEVQHYLNMFPVVPVSPVQYGGKS